MSFLLKIVEGPNKGAEIALVEGVAVTLGKSDTCDIVLADTTLGDEPLVIEASADGVTLGGETIEPFHVTVCGSTAFAVGPSDSPWGELVWPSSEAPKREDAEEPDHQEEKRDEGGEAPTPDPADGKGESEKKRHGCLGCLIVAIVMLLILAGLGWYFRGWLEPRVKELVGRVVHNAPPDAAETAAPHDAVGGKDLLASLVARYGLSTTNRNNRAVLVGNFKTRAERLAATAETYSAKPGVELDFADDESLKTAVADTLALVGETKMCVSAVTSRVAVLSGKVTNLRQTLEAISADVPKVVNVDVAGVVLANDGAVHDAIDTTMDDDDGWDVPGVLHRRRRSKKASAASPLPVCGILTTPYPCLVMRDGRRIMEGAPVGDSIVLKIESDSVTITNSTGRFTWKP
jgi:hypothetical protein